MRFTLDTPATLSVTSFTADGIVVGGQRYRSSILILTDGVREWDCTRVEQIGHSTLEPALDAEPEILLLGTGAKLAFPDASFMQALAKRGIGVEVMDTHAACRTFNILLQEERRVVAALIVD